MRQLISIFQGDKPIHDLHPRRRALGAALLATASQHLRRTSWRAHSDGVVKIGADRHQRPVHINVGSGSIVATEIAIEEFGGKVLGYSVQMVTGPTTRTVPTRAPPACGTSDR